MNKILETERLIIRPSLIDDWKDICEYGCDEDTGKFMIHWPKLPNEIKILINEAIKSMGSAQPDWFEFSICPKENKKVIGNVSLQLQGSSAEIGWISNKNYWNMGYMTEAVEIIIKEAFNTLKIHKIIATCSSNNPASYKVMEKCGMKRIKEDKNHIAVKNGKGICYDELTYCIYDKLR